MLDRAPRSGRAASRALVVLLLTLALLSLGPSALVAAAQEDSALGTTDPATLGVYITSLHDFDPANGSFGVDYWVWSVHPPELDPLESVEFVNAKQIESRLDQTSKGGELRWSRSKVRATVLHDWDLRNYPFDRQVLRIEFRNTGGFTYRTDAPNSGYAEGIEPEGWRITDFEIEDSTVDYATTFGNPEKPLGSGSGQEHVFATVEMQRDSVTNFLKLVAGVYAAIAITLLPFLMRPDTPPVFSGRMAVLVGALFATVVNLQVSNGVLGSGEDVSMVDKIHIVAMFYVFAAALMAVLSRRTFEAGRKELAERRDWISLFAFGVSFVLINVTLISLAAIVG